MSGLGGSTGFGVPATGCRRLAASGCASEMPPRPAKPVFPGFRRRRLQAPTALPRSRPGDRSYTTLQAASPCPPPDKNTNRNRARTIPHRPTREPASASSSRPVQAQSMRPRADNHRSRDAVVTRKPRDHSARARRSRSKARCHTPNPRPLRPAPRTAAACKAHFWLLFLQPKKVTRP